MNEVIALVREAFVSQDVKVIAAVVAAAVAGLVVVAAALKRVRALVQKARSAALARSLLAQAVPAELVPPPEKAKHAELEARFRESLERLRSSRLGGGGDRALYTLPFQVMMGPSGSGKTTLIRGSGLDFLQGSEKIEAIPGIGGTRDCNWWFTNHGIILDTAGRYASEDADHDEWLTFLRLLRQHRADKPIDGVIIAVGVDLLMSADADEEVAVGLARDLRRRLDELCQELDVIPPVYLLVTKCDLLPGFRESFAEMSEREREQIWGFTLPLRLDVPVEDVFAREYGALLERVEARALWRVDLDRSRPDRQTSLLALLSTLEALGGDLSSLVGGLMRPDRYRHEPVLRGVYLTSGSQEGQPLAHLRQGTGAWASVGAEVDEGRSPARAITFFVKRLFLDVVFPDRSLARRTDIELRRARIREAVSLGSVGMAVMSSVLAIGGVLAANGELVARADGAALRLRGVVDAGRSVDAVVVQDVDHLVALVGALARFEVSGVPLRLRAFGFYAGEVLAGPLARFVELILRVSIHQPAFAADVETLRALAGRSGTARVLTAGEAQVGYAALRRHLLVTRRADEYGQPTRRASEEPDLEAYAREVESHVFGFWRARGASLPAAALRRVARARVLGMAAGRGGFFLRDEALVGSVRALLSRYYPESRCDLAQLEAMIAAEEVDLAALTKGDPFPLRAGGDGRVPGLFTRDAWMKARRLMRSPGSLCADGDWVLGRARVGDRTQAQRLDALMSEYAVAYAQRWRSYVESISIDFGRDCRQVEIALDAMTTSDNALSRLLEGLRGHMHLVEEEVSEAAAAVPALPWWRVLLEEKGGVSRRVVAKVARPTALEKREDGIWRDFLGLDNFCPQAGSAEVAALCDELRAAWAKLGELPITPESGDDSGAAQVIREGQREVQRILEQIDSRWQPWLHRLTGAMSDQVEMCVASNALCVLERAWSEQVAAPWEEGIARKYPFARHALVDAAPDAVRKLLGATEGSLWRFYEERLSAVVPRDGAGGFRRGGRVGAIDGSALASPLVRTLTEAAKVGRAPLDEGSVEVSIHPVEHPDFFVERTTLRAGEQTYSFTNAKHRPQRLPWPLVGEDGVRLSVAGRRTRASLAAVGQSASGEPMDQTLHYPGPWGILRLIDDSRVQVLAGGERLVLTKTLHDLMGAEVVIELGLNPAAAAIFTGDRRRGDPLAMVRGLEPPPALLAAGSSCAPRGGEDGSR
ncbi:MAG TPA: type VI secretion protein IcmF/TssM N-terminal domain-containing protein [Nannocystaceae bacterium]|nr:type VI secretion protein IcmF/TssM N-terminal domain-containing protein [Nannocystaceae bacterium]